LAQSIADSDLKASATAVAIAFACSVEKCALSRKARDSFNVSKDGPVMSYFRHLAERSGCSEATEISMLFFAAALRNPRANIDQLADCNLFL
jgi:hypothetical protein